MVLVTGALGRVILKLGKLLHKEYKLQKGVTKKLSALSRDLEFMHAALRKVVEVPPNQLDELVLRWARDVSELSYNVEDILDTFLLRVECHDGAPDPNWFKRVVKQIAGVFSKTKARHQIAGMIKIVNEKAAEMEDRRQKYKLDDIAAKPAPEDDDRRLKLMYKEVAQLVGIHKSSSELESILCSSQREDEVSNKKLKIVSVVGSGGLGKTTIAKVVFDKLKSKYDCGAFVSVGRNPDLVEVFKNIHFVLNKVEYHSIRELKSLDLLIAELRNFLTNKRYLIVIDDIWEIGPWDYIYSALVEDTNGSRIMTTTRKVDVAPGMVYTLQPLCSKNAKKLFYTRLYGGEEKCPNNHPDEVSNKILNKCGGVPLAIITMACLLLDKSRDEWLEVCNSPGFYREKDDRHMENTMHILSLSYYDLPSHLKTCLLYLSVFPEDCVIDKASLIWKWIAEDFVVAKPGLQLFEVGQEYIHDLINRSMIQEVELDTGFFNSKGHGPPFYGCRVHDMVLDLICSKSNEETFVSGDGTLSENSARRFAPKRRTLDLSHNNIHGDPAVPKLRSFIAFGCRIDNWSFHPRFELMRVLDLDNCRFGKDSSGLEHVGSLLCLRYLGIRSPLHRLPEEIGALKFLQILDLKMDLVPELPLSVGSLTRLVCLRARRTRVPDGIIGKLTLLEELQVFPPESHESKRQFVMDLGNLRELRVLCTEIYYLMCEGMQSDLVHSLSKLHMIRNITLDGVAFYVEHKYWNTALVLPRLQYFSAPYMTFHRLPSCINSSSLPRLCSLKLFVDTMDDQALKNIGGLLELRYLHLSTKSTARLADVTADGCFQKLRSCRLPESLVYFAANEDSSVSFSIWNGRDGMALGPNKKEERRVAPAIMPNLEELEFVVNVQLLMQNNVSCDNLGLEYLPSLKKVSVHWEATGSVAALRKAIEGHPNRPTLKFL